MILTLAGNNRLELKKRLDKLVEDFVSQNGELAVERIDGEEATVQAVMEAVASLPFLAAKKMVIVRNLSADKTAAEALEQIIAAASDSTDLIFYEISPDKRTVFYKTLKSKTNLEEFDAIDAGRLPGWLVKFAADQGADLNSADANYLIERAGASQQLLASELEKLITYDPKITRESIDLLTVKAPQSRIFDLLDAAFLGNKQKALKLYDEQRAQKIEPQEIMSMIAWQLRLIVLAKLGAGRSAADIGKDAGLSSFPVGKAQNLAAKLSMSNLKKMVFEAEKIDRLGKSKPIDLDEAIKTYITTL